MNSVTDDMLLYFDAIVDDTAKLLIEELAKQYGMPFAEMVCRVEGVLMVGYIKSWPVEETKDLFFNEYLPLLHKVGVANAEAQRAEEN